MPLDPELVISYDGLYGVNNEIAKLQRNEILLKRRLVRNAQFARRGSAREGTQCHTTNVRHSPDPRCYESARDSECWCDAEKASDEECCATSGRGGLVFVRPRSRCSN